MMGRRQRRGHILIGALMVVFALVAVTAIGFRARTTDLGFEDDALARRQAHEAAQSALARVKGRLGRGAWSTARVRVQGSLPSTKNCRTIEYATRVPKMEAGATKQVRLTGRCRAADRTHEVVIDVGLRPSSATRRWQVVSWQPVPHPS